MFDNLSEVSEVEFSEFVEQHNLEKIEGEAHEIQYDFVDSNKNVLAEHEIIACHDIYRIHVAAFN